MVDDGSEEDVRARLSQICEEEGAAFLYHEDNRGFAKTCNAGMEQSNGDAVILMNNDIRMLGPTLDMLADAVLTSRAGVMGIRLLYPDYSIQHAGQVVILGPNGAYFDHYRRHATRYDAEAIVMRRRLVTGALYAISRACIDAIGFFDENFGMAVEDVDYSLSAMEAGFSVFYNGYLEAIHLEGKTRGNTPADKMARNPTHAMAETVGMQYLFEKWAGVQWEQFVPQNR